jgi:hypothetical protein
MMRTTLVGALLLLAVGTLGGADDKGHQAFIDPEQAGPDFLIQGEYEGKLGTGWLGAQVIAEGDGKFQAVFLPGGLPGTVSDGKVRVRVPGKTDGDRTVFEGLKWTGTIANRQITGKTDTGESFTLDKVVRPSLTLGLKPPENAVVLFDGTNAEEWKGGKLVDDHLLNNGVVSKQAFRDFRLHLEFRLPFMPYARGQGRGNSGVYLQNRYECQILDSFGLEGKNNECGGFYTLSDPRVNACLPPLSWQTYDIEFRAARFDSAGKKTEDAIALVWLNGIPVQYKVRLKSQTPGGQKEEDKPGPLQLQNHGNPVYFRNIWVVEHREEGR